MNDRPRNFALVWSGREDSLAADRDCADVESDCQRGRVLFRGPGHGATGPADHGSNRPRRRPLRRIRRPISPTSSRSSAMTGAERVQSRSGRLADDVAGGAGRRRGSAIAALETVPQPCRDEQRRDLRAVSAGPSPGMGARRDPARAGCTRWSISLRCEPAAGRLSRRQWREAGRLTRLSASGATWRETTAGTG